MIGLGACGRYLVEVNLYVAAGRPISGLAVIHLVPYTYETAVVVIISQVQTLAAQDLFDLVDS